MKFEKVDPYEVYEMAVSRPAHNYFVCYTLNNKQPYESCWVLKENGILMVAVFFRKTKLVQVVYKPEVDLMAYRDDFKQLFSEQEWHQAVVTGQVKDVFDALSEQIEYENGAVIASCEASDYHCKAMETPPNVAIRTIDVDDIEAVVPLYTEVFKGFASLSYMKEKLEKGRGSALGLYIEGALVSVAQTDYETSDSVIIVGVATYKAHQGQGLGRLCFQALCDRLVQEGKKLYLQYDDPIAGRLYESVGFKTIEQIYKIEKRNNK